MKSQIKLIGLLLVLSMFTSCGDSKTLSYDESKQGAILEKDPSISPEDNLKDHLKNVEVAYSNVKILNENGEECACTNMNGKCTCKLENSKAAHACEVIDSKCTKKKVVEIDVSPEDESSFASLGFK